MTEATPSCCDCWCVNSNPLLRPNPKFKLCWSRVMQKHTNTDQFSQINDVAWVTTERNQAESLQDFILRWPTCLCDWSVPPTEEHVSNNAYGRYPSVSTLHSSYLGGGWTPSGTVDVTPSPILNFHCTIPPLQHGSTDIWSQTRPATSESHSFYERLPVSLSRAVPAGWLTLALSWHTLLC